VNKSHVDMSTGNRGQGSFSFIFSNKTPLQEMMGAGPRAGAVQYWIKPSEAAGGAEEAHRRCPKGAASRSGSKTKVDPPEVGALARGS
jgi:hypothetical protein